MFIINIIKTETTGRVYQAKSSGTTGSTVPTHTNGRITDGVILWDYIDESQLYVGNSALTVPFNYTESTVPLVGLVLKNITVNSTVDYITNVNAHSGAFFFSTPIYGCSFDNIYVNSLEYGLSVVPPPVNFESYEYSSEECLLTTFSLKTRKPFIWYNAAHIICSNIQVYGSHEPTGAFKGDKGASVLSYKSLNFTKSADFQFQSLYQELAGGSFTMARYDGEFFTFNSPGLRQGYGSGTFDIACDNSLFLNCGYLADTLSFMCNKSRFENTLIRNFALKINNTGLGNKFLATKTSDYEINSSKAINLIKTSDQVFLQNADFLGVVPTKPFTSKNDLFWSASDLAYSTGSGLGGQLSFDETQETGLYSKFSSTYFSQANGKALTIGSTILPAIKYRVFYKMKADSVANANIAFVANSVGVAFTGGSLTTSFNVLDGGIVDFTSLSGQNLVVQLNGTSTGHAQYLAWFVLVPIQQSFDIDKKAGKTTLVSGVKAITVSGLTSNSVPYVQLISTSNNSLTAHYKAVCSSNTLTITAIKSDGTTNTADVSDVGYLIAN